MKNVLFFISFFITFTVTAQQQGTLDSSFAVNGVALNTDTYNLRCIAFQKNGKIVAGGTVSNEGISGCGLVRYNTNGSIDSTFGNNGYAILDAEIYNQWEFSGIDILEDDKIVATVAGTNIFVAKFTADGKLDSSFGTNGYALNHFTFIEFMVSIKVDADNNIIVTGSQTAGFYEPSYGIILRYTPEGMLDTSFADSGKAVLYESEGIASLAVQNDGKIIAGGGDDGRFFIARLNKDGSYDHSFGSNTGYVYTRFFKNRDDRLSSIVLQPDGKILAGGYCNDIIITPDMGIARYNTNGNLDSSFGTNGLKAIEINSASEATAVLLQKDGNIILSGRTFNDGVNKSDAMLVKLHASGNIDSSFGTNGISITNLSNGGYDYEYSALLQADGKILVAGQSTLDDTYGNIARFNNIDESRRQILIAKLRRWWQRHNGIAWDNLPGAKSYAVQRSSNGVAWSTVHRQQSTANSRSSIVNAPLSTVNSYADPSPLPGTNYYRLQTTSVDGAVAYSNVVAISNELSVMSISPNPARSVLRIEGLPSNQKIKITIVDIAGNVAMNYEPLAIRPSSLNISTLKPGNYLLRVETDGEVITKQFVKE